MAKAGKQRGQCSFLLLHVCTYYVHYIQYIRRYVWVEEDKAQRRNQTSRSKRTQSQGVHVNVSHVQYYVQYGMYAALTSLALIFGGKHIFFVLIVCTYLCSKTNSQVEFLQKASNNFNFQRVHSYSTPNDFVQLQYTAGILFLRSVQYRQHSIFIDHYHHAKKN